MFPIQEETEEREQTEPFNIEYVITAKGLRSSGSIKYDPKKEMGFWGLLQMVITDIIEGKDHSYLNESYTDGFSRFRRQVKRDTKTWRWEELDYHSSEQE